MKIPSGFGRPKTGQGFTLLEVLLATVLLMLLVGAIVFNYSTLQRGAALEEGATQFEGLLRYAQAEAASTGRKVQLVIEEEVIDDWLLVWSKVQVLWEPEPLAQPGEWVELATAKELVKGIQELVQIETAEVFEAGELSLAQSQTASTNKVDAGSFEGEETEGLITVTFYPDGSSDSAEFTLMAQDPEDLRRIRVCLVGITGMIHRRFPAVESEGTPTEEEKGEPEAKTEKTPTVSSEPTESVTIPAPAPVPTEAK